jgi:rubrerythrin
MDAVWIVLLLVGIGALGMLSGSGRSREDLRMRGRWDTRFEIESRRQTHTDATGMLMCRSCGTGAPERAGRCPSCGAVL